MDKSMSREEFLANLRETAGRHGISPDDLAKAILRSLTPQKINYDLKWCPKVNHKAERSSELGRLTKRLQDQAYA